MASSTAWSSMRLNTAASRRPASKPSRAWTSAAGRSKLPTTSLLMAMGFPSASRRAQAEQSSRDMMARISQSRSAWKGRPSAGILRQPSTRGHSISRASHGVGPLSAPRSTRRGGRARRLLDPRVVENPLSGRLDRFAAIPSRGNAKKGLDLAVTQRVVAEQLDGVNAELGNLATVAGEPNERIDGDGSLGAKGIQRAPKDDRLAVPIEHAGRRLARDLLVGSPRELRHRLRPPPGVRIAESRVPERGGITPHVHLRAGGSLRSAGRG